MLWRPRADAGEATGLPGKNSKRIVSLGHLVLQQPNTRNPTAGSRCCIRQRQMRGWSDRLRRRRCTRLRKMEIWADGVKKSETYHCVRAAGLRGCTAHACIRHRQDRSARGHYRWESGIEDELQPGSAV